MDTRSDIQSLARTRLAQRNRVQQVLPLLIVARPDCEWGLLNAGMNAINRVTVSLLDQSEISLAGRDEQDMKTV
jgi:hypothetical protein